MATRFKLEVNLDHPGLASVEDLAGALRRAADQLVHTCGSDCDFAAHCKRCWSDLALLDPDGRRIGTGTIVVE